MKTSNKLLIAFGLALILIPLLGMIYVSRVNYKAGDPNHQYDVVYDNNHFNSKDPDMIANKIGAFSKVEVLNANGYRVNIRLVADADYGTKVQSHMKDQVSFKVDANGKLNIELKDIIDNTYITIIVYAPNISDLVIANAERLTLTVSQDSLNVNAKNIRKVEFGSAKNAKKINFSADSVENFIVYNEVIQSMVVNLKNSDFETEKSSFVNLSINANGSNVAIVGNEDENDKYTVANLSLNTTDKAKVKVSNIKVDNCSGKLSDQTTVEMPAINLNQMFKK